MQKKRALTLLEIMIVIVLIGIIGSVIGVNMKGSLDKGKAFKTKQAMQQIEDILMLQVAQGATIDEVVGDPEGYLRDSGMVKDPATFINDGWDQRFDIRRDGRSNDKIIVSSERLDAYEAKKTRKK